MRTRLLAVLVAMAGLSGTYAALGGGRYQSGPLADPCATRPWSAPRGAQAVTERILITALDSAACRLRVGREELLLSLRSESERQSFGRVHGIDDAKLDAAVRDGLRGAVAEARDNGALGERTASLLGVLVDRVPLTSALSIAGQVLD